MGHFDDIGSSIMTAFRESIGLNENDTIQRTTCEGLPVDMVLGGLEGEEVIDIKEVTSKVLDESNFSFGVFSGPSVLPDRFLTTSEVDELKSAAEAIAKLSEEAAG